MLCVGRLLGLFSYAIGVHIVDHRGDGSTVVCLAYKVVAECSSVLADWSEEQRIHL